MQPEVSILIVAYNSAGFIGDCIESIYAHTQQTTFEILLIDNGTDDTAALVEKRFSQVRIVPPEGNIGFGGGNNRLAAHATGQVLLLLNPDTRLEDPAIDQLMAFRRSQPQARAWGGRTRTPQGVLDAGNFMAFPSLPGMLRAALGLAPKHGRDLLGKEADQPARVAILPGGFFAMDRSAWDMLGGFDEGFFLYSEEIDLFRRFAEAGFEAWASPDIHVIHDVGSGAIHSPSRTLFKTRGQMHYLRKHWPGGQAALGGALIWLHAALRLILIAPLVPLVPRLQARCRALAPIVQHPGKWWRGYSSESAASIP